MSVRQDHKSKGDNQSVKCVGAVTPEAVTGRAEDMAQLVECSTNIRLWVPSAFIRKDQGFKVSLSTEQVPGQPELHEATRNN